MTEENPYAASQIEEPVAVWKERAALTTTRVVLGWITFLAGSIGGMFLSMVTFFLVELMMRESGVTGNSPGLDLLGFPLFLALNYIAYWFSIRQVILPGVTQRTRKFAQINLPPS